MRRSARTSQAAATEAAVRAELAGDAPDPVELRPVARSGADDAIALALARWLVADLLRHPENDP